MNTKNFYRLIIFIIILSGCTKNNNLERPAEVKNESIKLNDYETYDTQEGFPKFMYVIAKEGLIERTRPSTSSERASQKPYTYGEQIEVFSRQDYTDTINGITDYWYRTTVGNDRWVFGGYLYEELPDDLPFFIGYWDGGPGTKWYYRFDPDHTIGMGQKEMGGGGYGKWKYIFT
ncbi:hypothetical protein [Treponema sp. R6D11]